MVIMDAYYSPDRLLQIWQQIDQLHLSYLEMEESPEKLEHRNKLEECIREYLWMAPHSQKFTFTETGEVLYRSASNKKDFSGYKAATGWNAIQLYAGNLLSQPWRKEYRLVKTYCGFYKHQIEANLVGAEIMFEAMGYKHAGDGILILDGPICPDRVTSVSKDCLIAYVECQIIKAIWEEISPSFNITWLEVLEFRKTHLCGPEQAIRALTYQYHQKQYQEHTRSYSQGSDPYGGGGGSSSRYLQNIPSVLHSNHSFPPLTGHSHPGMPPPPPPPAMPPQYIYASNGCCANNYGAYSVPHHYPMSVPMPYHAPVKTPYSNGYYCHNGYIPQPVYDVYRVPTGQLIELDSHNGGSYDVVDKPRERDNNRNRESKNSVSNHEGKKIDPKYVLRDSDKEESRFEDWDYVYRSLESKGYSKDLGDRGDILSPSTEEKIRKKSKSTNLDEALNNLTLTTTRPLKISEALDKYENDKVKIVEQQEQPKRASESSSYENLSDIKKPSSKITKTKEKVKNVEPPKKIDKWQCKTCTFLNIHSKDICEMCSRSRRNVEQQIEIGGAECSKCTLVNSKDKSVCEACGASLKNSPTYI